MNPYNAELDEILGWVRHSVRCNAVPVGLVIAGVSGVGKTHLCQTLLTSTEFDGNLINGEAVFQHESPVKYFNRLIDDALASSTPYLFVVDQLDALCAADPSQSRDGTGIESQVILAVADRLDQLRLHRQHHQVFFIATTSRLESVHPLIRRAGRLSLTVQLNRPSVLQRQLILHNALAVGFAKAGNNEHTQHMLAQVSERTQGYVAADLRLLCQQAVMHAAKEVDQSSSSSSSPSPSPPPSSRTTLSSSASSSRSRTQTHLALDHFVKALETTRPAHLAEFPSNLLRMVSSNELAGVDAIFTELKHTANLCFSQAERCTSLGVAPPRGLLLLGPAGCGKTTLALALASSLGVNVLPIYASSVRAKVVGHAEETLRKLFRRAIDSQPCVLLIDQLESLAEVKSTESGRGDSHERLLSTLSSLLDECLSSISTKIVVLGTCRRLDAIDSSVYRPGRLDMHFAIDMPDDEARAAILKQKLGKMPGGKHLVGTKGFDHVVASTQGATGADIDNICREGAILALRENLNTETMEERHLIQAMVATNAPQQPSLTFHH
eukprot:m.171431 g.171431  ORF g.171431 m.171431 type:complete len:553 (-) comp31650_c0_seq2:209-1867(-)